MKDDKKDERKDILSKNVKDAERVDEVNENNKRVQERMKKDKKED